MLAAMSSCLVLGFLLSMAEVPWMVAALLMVSLLCGCFCSSCRAWHVPTCRTPPGEGGGSKCKERGITHPWSAAERAKGCTSEARKPGETPCAREGRHPLARFGYRIRARERTRTNRVG